jgi:choline-phosphate cytidylyltransferase
MVVIYTDGVYDLFHRGHIENLKKCMALFDNVYLIVGVLSDEVASSYKRCPIYSEQDRYTLIENVKGVNQVVKNAPLIITEDFLELYKIDYVVHGFSTQMDKSKQTSFFEIPIKLNKFIEIDYYTSISTTEIIQRLRYPMNISSAGLGDLIDA